jgi:superfamily II DNA or RNA helicase
MSDFRSVLTNGIIAGFVDQNVECRKELMPTFLSNDRAKGQRILSNILYELENCEEFWFSVAFVTSSGVMCILELLKELEEKEIPGKILVSKYQNFTEPSALRRLEKFKNLSIRISENRNFHAKAFLFRNKEGYNLIIGSSNLTSGALSVNKEWNLRVSSTHQGKLIIETLKEFKKEFESSTLVDINYIDKYEIEYNLLKLARATVFDKIEQTQKIVPNRMQLAALERLEYLRKQGKSKALLISATGTGKTYLSAFDVQKFNPKRFLFIVHRQTIAQEAMRSFGRILGKDKSMGLFSGEAKDIEADYIFSTVQTVSKTENLMLFERDEFEYLVIDETHRSGAESYRRILEYFQPKFLLGMTATPERTDGYDIFSQFDYNIASEIRLNQALEEEMLCPFHYYGITDVTVNGVLIEEDAAFNLLTSMERVDRIIEKARFYGCDSGDVRGLVFCRNIEESNFLAQAFNSSGIKSVSLTGKSTNEQREDAIQKLESDVSDKLDYIFSVDIFNEGVDIPGVNQIILLRPTQSAIVFVQQLGRGLRRKSGKSFLTVIDFIGNYSNNYLIPIALFGDRSFDGETLRKLISSGSALVPGESTVSFEAIAKERIFHSINNSNWQKSKDFNNDFDLLKFRIGRDPLMVDFISNDFRDPYQFVYHYRSYFNFLKKKDIKYSEQLNEAECKCLELISQEVLNNVRYEEHLLVQFLIESGSVSTDSFANAIERYLGGEVNDRLIESVVSNLNLLFVRESENGKQVPVGMKYRLKMVERIGNTIQASSTLQRMLSNGHFLLYLTDVNTAGMAMFSKRFSKDRYSYGFILYHRYSRKDVFRILKWKENPVAQNVGGYMLSGDRKDMAIFVTYHKDEEIASSIKYEERFLSRSVFEWMSKNKRTLNSPEIVALRNYPNMLIPLFIKKSDDEGTEFYFMGMMKPLEGSYRSSTIAGKDGKPVSVVTVEFVLSTPVEESLYMYLTRS